MGATRTKAKTKKGRKGSNSSKRDGQLSKPCKCIRCRGGGTRDRHGRITCQVPYCIRHGKSKASTVEEAVKVTQNAVEFYNSSHKGEEIQFLELNVACRAPCMTHTVFHVNFMAKPVNADSDQSPKCFFAEVKPYLPTIKHVMCEKLVEGSVGGRCDYCCPAFGIVHPPCGFRGYRPLR